MESDRARSVVEESEQCSNDVCQLLFHHVISIASRFWFLYDFFIYISRICDLSMFCFQEVHIILLERYSLPTWGSYLIFALATILLGSIIGLVLIFYVHVV